MRKIRELNQRKHLDWFTKQMAAINRKQVPLCSLHHQKLHAGTFSRAERESYSEGIKRVPRHQRRKGSQFASAELEKIRTTTKSFTRELLPESRVR